MKNVIAALYSSRSGGKKAFAKGGVALGWQPIVDQYNRDQHRVALGIGRRVPGLRYSYVERDCWTRLNVMPAKIMQVIIILFSLFCLKNCQNESYTWKQCPIVGNAYIFYQTLTYSSSLVLNRANKAAIVNLTNFL